jgi:(R,R)-butanediol dehydrogenase/meso-butanediol dehydrogenase/diacetyl reductase
VVVEARGRTEGHAGVHVAFDATGLQSTLTTAIAAIRPGGTVFNVAVHKQPLVIDVNSVSLWEKKLTGGIGASDDDFRGVIAAMASGGLRTEGFITSVVKLSHAVQGGLRELLNNRDEHIKILIEPE